jgi:catalase
VNVEWERPSHLRADGIGPQRPVSAQTGIKIAPIGTPKHPTPSASTPSGPLRPDAKDLSSPALSQDKPGDTIKGRKIAILGGNGVDAEQLEAVKEALIAQEALVELIAAHAGIITDSTGKPQKVNRADLNAPSVIYDAVVVLGGSSADALAKSGLAIHFINEAYRDGKLIAAIADGSLLLDACSLGARAPAEPSRSTDRQSGRSSPASRRSYHLRLR